MLAGAVSHTMKLPLEMLAIAASPPDLEQAYAEKDLAPRPVIAIAQDRSPTGCAQRSDRFGKRSFASPLDGHGVALCAIATIMGTHP